MILILCIILYLVPKAHSNSSNYNSPLRAPLNCDSPCALAPCYPPVSFSSFPSSVDKHRIKTCIVPQLTIPYMRGKFPYKIGFNCPGNIQKPTKTRAFAFIPSSFYRSHLFVVVVPYDFTEIFMAEANKIHRTNKTANLALTESY